MSKRIITAAAVGAVVFGPANSASATTLERTLQPVGDARSIDVATAPGEPHLVRAAPRVQASASRTGRRRSLAYFAHLTDPQIVDETSPARFELLDSAGGKFGAFWRPQEAFSLQVLDQAVRAVNRSRVSPISSAEGRARMGFALMTGDLADNAQRNELRWAVETLDGGVVDPFSGRSLTARNRCRGAGAAARRLLNAAVALRLYTGVQDFADWPGQPAARYRDFWDPGAPVDRAGRYPRLARYPGVLERAQRPFVAEGLRVPWLSVRGNHDATPQGMYGPGRTRPRAAVTGCRKLFPARSLNPRGFRGDPWVLLRRRLSRARLVPPDPRRRFITSAADFRRLHGRADRGHGFALTPRVERRRSRGAATYYAWSPRRGLRFISLDTAADAAGPNGNLDHPQYRWLGRELRRAQRRRQLVVVYGHHSLETMRNPVSDEAAGRFDRDPRRSRPIHKGREGRASVRGLLLRHRNVILYVAGHVHRSQVLPNFRRDGGGFWQITTAALIAAPQQGRLLELMENGDGTLSIFSTMLDHAAPPAPPRPGTPGSKLTDSQLGSLARLLAWSHAPLAPRPVHPRPGSGARNVELVLRDPRARR